MLAMTTPDERTRAVLHTREFLEELLSIGAERGVPDALREQARRLLRHYPRVMDLQLASTALPQHFGPPTVGPE